MARNKFFIIFLIILISGCNFFSNNNSSSKLKPKKVKRVEFKKKKKPLNHLKTQKNNNQNKSNKKFVYNIESIKRNPFEPFIKKIEQPVVPEKIVVTPLTEYSINQYRFVAIVTDKKPPLGMVETEDNRGLIFSLGDYIGSELYRVIKISSDKIILQRKFYDYFKRLKIEKLTIKLDTTGE